MIKGYTTAADAAGEFRVSTKTLNNWVESWVSKGLIEEPPIFEYGLRRIRYFPQSYIAKLDRLRRKMAKKISAK